MSNNRVINILDKLKDEYEHDVFAAMRHKDLIYQDDDLRLDNIAKFASCLRKLHEVIKDVNIHLNCGIFEDFLLSTLKLDKDTLTIKEAEEIIPFNQPEDSGWRCSIHGLFKYFKLNQKTGNLGAVHLQNIKDLEDIATRFKAWFAELPLHQIDKYQLKSLYLLQNVACNKSALFAGEIANELNQKGSAISKTELHLLQLSTQLVGITTIIHPREPHFYLQTIQKQLDEMLSSIYFSKKHQWLLENVTNYLRYNQNYQIVESFNKNCPDDFRKFFAKYKINVHDADVIEETLLKAAGIEVPQSIHCRLDLPSSYDTSKRVKLRFNGLSLESAEQLRIYLVQYDYTVHLKQSKFRPHWTDNLGWPQEKVDTINVTLNPRTFNERIVPIIKETFLKRLEQKDPRIADYQRVSEKEFIQKERSIEAKKAAEEEAKITKYSYSPKLFTVSKSGIEETPAGAALAPEVEAEIKNTIMI